MNDPRDYKLDVSGLKPADTPGSPAGAANARPYISVHFTCCSVYLRIYRSPDTATYRGRCPRCGKSVTFAVGPGGTTSRSFVVG